MKHHRFAAALLAAVGLVCTASAQPQTKSERMTGNRQPSKASMVTPKVKQNIVVGRADATDLCGDAPTVGDGTYSYDLNGMSNDYAGICGGTATAPDVWLKYHATGAGIVTVSTCGISGGDSVLSVIDGCGGATIVCLDDFCGLQTEISFAAAADTDYLVRIAGFAGGVHAGSVNISNAGGGGAPANDNCADATAIAGDGTFNFNSNSSTTDGGNDGLCDAAGSDQIFNDVWYVWTAPGGGTHVRIQTCGQTVLDSRIAVYAGDSCSDAIIACNDDSCGSLQSSVVAEAAPGSRHLIRIGAYSAAGYGSGTFTITSFTPVDNDFCTDAVPVGPGTHDFTTEGASNDYAATCGATASAEDVWFSYTAGATNELVSVSTCGLSGDDTVLAAVDSCGGTQLACNDDSCGLQSNIQYVANAGSTTYIRLARFAGGVASGQFSLAAEPIVSPTNDHCADATLVGEGTHAWNTVAADTDGSAGCGFGGDPGSKDVWFKFVATRDGAAFIDTCGQTTVDTIISAYDACGGTEIACNDDFCGLQSTISFNITNGSTYWVRISGYFGASGTGTVTIAFGEPCDITAPGGSTDEGEGCGNDTNGGCNRGDGAVSYIGVNEVVFGTAWAQGGTRDTDWFEFTLDQDASITIRGTAEFPAQVLLLDANCPPAILAFATGARPCVEQTVAMDLPAGTYRAFMSTSGFDGTPCGNANDYTLVVEGPGGCVGDFNNDGFVDFFDYAAFDDCFNGLGCPPGRDADVNNDDFVDFFDLDFFLEVFEAGC